MIILIRKNEIADEVLDVKFEPLQGRYQHLLYQSPNQPKQSISNDQCSKFIESNMQNQELNKVTPPLNKVPSCEEQLAEIHEIYNGK